MRHFIAAIAFFTLASTTACAGSNLRAKPAPLTPAPVPRGAYHAGSASSAADRAATRNQMRREQHAGSFDRCDRRFCDPTR